MSQPIRQVASKAGYTFLAFVSTFAVLWPASRAMAEEAVSVPVPDFLMDIIQVVGVACIPAMLVEVLRLSVPWLARKDGTGDLQKAILRILSVGIGTLMGWHGLAPAVADGSNPRLLGGIAAGCIAALFGGLLIGKIKDRVKAIGSAA